MTSTTRTGTDLTPLEAAADRTLTRQRSLATTSWTLNIVGQVITNRRRSDEHLRDGEWALRQLLHRAVEGAQLDLARLALLSDDPDFVRDVARNVTSVWQTTSPLRLLTVTGAMPSSWSASEADELRNALDEALADIGVPTSSRDAGPPLLANYRIPDELVGTGRSTAPRAAAIVAQRARALCSELSYATQHLLGAPHGDRDLPMDAIRAFNHTLLADEMDAREAAEAANSRPTAAEVAAAEVIAADRLGYIAYEFTPTLQAPPPTVHWNNDDARDRFDERLSGLHR